MFIYKKFLAIFVFVSLIFSFTNTSIFSAAVNSMNINPSPLSLSLSSGKFVGSFSVNAYSLNEYGCVNLPSSYSIGGQTFYHNGVSLNGNAIWSTFPQFCGSGSFGATVNISVPSTVTAGTYSYTVTSDIINSVTDMPISKTGNIVVPETKYRVNSYSVVYPSSGATFVGKYFYSCDSPGDYTKCNLVSIANNSSQVWVNGSGFANAAGDYIGAATQAPGIYVGSLNWGLFANISSVNVVNALLMGNNYASPTPVTLVQIGFGSGFNASGYSTVGTYSQEITSPSPPPQPLPLPPTLTLTGESITLQAGTTKTDNTVNVSASNISGSINYFITRSVGLSDADIPSTTSSTATSNTYSVTAKSDATSPQSVTITASATGINPPASVIIPVTIIAPPKPDLTASAPSPNIATVGVPQTFSSSISNIGEASTNSSFSNMMQVAEGPNGLDPVDTVSASQLQTIDADMQKTASASYTFSSLGSYSGSYSVRFCADNSIYMAGTISESDEGNNCSPWTDVTVRVPITTPSCSFPTATNITSTTATLGGNITSNGGAAITERGTAVGPYADPTNGIPEGGTATGIFTQNRTGFNPNTTYHYRAYATNSAGTGYCPDAIFTTLPPPPSGTLSVSPTSCTIPDNVSTCPVGVKWDVLNPIAEAKTAVTKDNPVGTTVSMGTFGSKNEYINYGTTNFFLYHNGSQLDTTKTATASCASTSDYVSGVCRAKSTITATQVPNCTITPSGATSTIYGSDQLYIITPANGYNVSSLIIDGFTITGATSKIFSNVTANHTISAICTVSACTNGAINPPTCTPVGVCSSPMTAYDCKIGASGSNSLSYSGLNSNYSWSCTTAGGGASCSQTKVMSGKLTPKYPSCIITSGSSSCYINYSWDTINPQGTSAITSNVDDNGTARSSTVAAGNYGTDIPLIVPFSSRTFYLYNNAQPLAISIVTSNCASGTTWNTTSRTCAPNLCAAPTSETRTTTSCPVGQTGTITETRTKSAYPGCTWGSWTETSNTCTLNTYTVSGTAGAGGTISPASRTVSYGNTTTFTITPNAGYSALASGCGGSLSGTTYTTGTITANCTVTATFSLIPIMSGTLTPASPSCIITSGNSSCNANLTWSITNLEGNTTAITWSGGSSTVSNSLTPSSQSGAQSVTVPYSSRTFYLYNNAKSLVPTSPNGAGIIVTATCASGTEWKSSGKCLPIATPISVSISANPQSMTLPSNSITLSWNTNGSPTSCTASGDWSGAKATLGGSENKTGLVARNYTYTITCSKFEVPDATSSVTVTVNSALVMSGILNANPSPCYISAGNSSCNTTLTWKVTNPVVGGGSAITSSINNSGTSSPNFQVTTGDSGGIAVLIPYDSGNSLVAQVSASIPGGGSRDFYLYNNGELLDQVTVNSIFPPIPTASISATPSSVASGEAVTITWSSTNATSCTGTGLGFNTGGATSGSITVNPTSNTTYELSCDNETVVATSSTTVTISTTGTKKKPIFKEN